MLCSSVLRLQMAKRQFEKDMAEQQQAARQQAQQQAPRQAGGKAGGALEALDGTQRAAPSARESTLAGSSEGETTLRLSATRPCTYLHIDQHGSPLAAGNKEQAEIKAHYPVLSSAESTLIPMEDLLFPC